MTQNDELEQLKQLLFEEELQIVATLRKQLEPQQRVTDTAEILADSIKIAATNNQRFVTALNDPVAECIRNIVAEKPQQFADSLFPVIGPAIRKSISEALKSFVQSTNEMIEQSMSPKSLRWRWEAKRSGVPFSEIVLKHSLLYRVEEVFLIQQGSGLLIEHVSHPDVHINDSDAISAMLTVIRDFSRDSFSAEASDSLDTVEFGERTLWMIEGPKRCWPASTAVWYQKPIGHLAIGAGTIPYAVWCRNRTLFRRPWRKPRISGITYNLPYATEQDSRKYSQF